MATAMFNDQDSSDELWKECAEWLTRWGMLRMDHKANWPDACIADLANILRDGVLLCKLLNKIDPGCIDMKDVNLKPAMAQFLSLRNIELFLKVCVNTFGLRQHDLFEPLLLFELTNFHKVLCTLSKLSLSPKVVQSGIPGFAAQRVKSKEEELIYQSLKSVDMPDYSRSRNEPMYDVTSEEIYQDLCDPPTVRCLEIQPTFEKRDFVLKELLDTEKNYVEVLGKLKTNFMKPMHSIMSQSDHDKVFCKIHELYDIHTAFYNELLKLAGNPQNKLSAIFMRWRERFLVYGTYCANLTGATNLLQELCDNNENFNEFVIKQEKLDNNGRFKLRDVLSVPMQRILKYHLLLEKLIENTDPNHEECNELKRAREAMLDVAGYINETARDSEHLAVIKSLQDNIVEWIHPTELKLQDFGKLIKDGELKIKGHDDHKTRSRYIFIFDKFVLICKQLKGQQFAYRNIIPIADYHVDEAHQRAILNREARWAYQFHLVKNDSMTCFTFFVRTLEIKEQMIKALRDALDNINPPAMEQTNHNFEMKTFDKPTQCFHCSKYLRGLIFQGYKCKKCQIAVHKICIGMSGRCPPQQQTHQQQHSPSTMLSSNLPLSFHHQHSQSLTNGEEASLRNKLWFVGEMDRARAQHELERRENGTFLVRVRPQWEEHFKYALTLKTNDNVRHMKIIETQNDGEKKFYLSLTKFFNNIEELVLNYQMNSLKENFERLEENSKLLWPYRQLRATVLQNFDASEAVHLQLIEGETIIIVGQEGYREGWWKGRSENDETGYFPSTFVRVDGEVRFNVV